MNCVGREKMSAGEWKTVVCSVWLLSSSVPSVAKEPCKICLNGVLSSNKTTFIKNEWIAKTKSFPKEIAQKADIYHHHIRKGPNHARLTWGIVTTSGPVTGAAQGAHCCKWPNGNAAHIIRLTYEITLINTTDSYCFHSLLFWIRRERLYKIKLFFYPFQILSLSNHRKQ